MTHCAHNLSGLTQTEDDIQHRQHFSVETDPTWDQTTDHDRFRKLSIEAMSEIITEPRFRWPKTLTMNKFERQYECQTKLIYSLIVAGKSADFADKAMRRFIEEVANQTGHKPGNVLPFDMLRELNEVGVFTAVAKAKTGNYFKIAQAINKLLDIQIDFETCTPADLEQIPGIGPKTSRFFIMWIRPNEQYAALDVHVLRWMTAQGYHDIPKSTPQNMDQYRAIELLFLAEAKKRNKTARQLDSEIWEAGAGRTQHAAL